MEKWVVYSLTWPLIASVIGVLNFSLQFHNLLVSLHLGTASWRGILDTVNNKFLKQRSKAKIHGLNKKYKIKEHHVLKKENGKPCVREWLPSGMVPNIYLSFSVMAWGGAGVWCFLLIHILTVTLWKSYMWTADKEKFAWKKKKNIQARTGFKPMTSATPVQRSINWANKLTGSWSLCWFQIKPWSNE